MEPNKLETDFRNKLNQREIQPSENAWDRLDAMLTVAEENKPKGSFGWLYIAASIIGFIFVGAIFFSQTEEVIDVKRNSVVIENNSSNTPVENTISGKVKEVQPEIIQNEAIASTIESKKIKSNPKKETTSDKVSIIKNQNNQNQIAENTKDPETSQKNEIQNIEKPINNLPQQIVANVEQVAQNSNTNSKIKVDANSLLSQVDGELELSFREKVIKKIDKNYKSVKLALANRNQQ